MDKLPAGMAMKITWRNCDIIADHIRMQLQLTEYPKTKVYNVYNGIVQMGSLQMALEGNKDVLVNIVKAIDMHEALLKREEEEREAFYKKTAPKIPKKTKTIKVEKVYDSSPAGKLRLGLWFIGKMESPDEALRIIRAAVDTLKTMEKKK